MKIRTLLLIPMTLAALALFSVGAQASTVTINLGTLLPGEIGCQNNPAVPTANCWTAGIEPGNARHYQTADNSNATIVTAFQDGLFDAGGNLVKAGVPGFAGLDLLYKANSTDNPLSTNPAAEIGGLKDSYSTEFLFQAPDNDDYTGATISHDGGPAVDCMNSDCFLLVMDGAANPTAYLFILTMVWDGQMDLVLKNFWGTDALGSAATGSVSNVQLWGKTTVIPIPAAAWLFGTALLGFIGLSRSTRV